MYICFYPDCLVVLKSILLYFDNCDDTIKIKNIEDEIQLKHKIHFPIKKNDVVQLEITGMTAVKYGIMMNYAKGCS